MTKPEHIYKEIHKTEQDRLIQTYYDFIERDYSTELEQNAILRFIKFLLQN